MSRANEPAFNSRGAMLFYVPDSAIDGVKEQVESMKQACSGLTIREHFAGLAMQGVLVAAQSPSVAEIPETLALVAKTSVAAADALIAELSK